MVVANADKVVEFLLGDVLELRRVHPCGGREWLVDRLGADIGLRCRTCDRHVMIERRTLERRVVRFVSRGDRSLSRAVAPSSADTADLSLPVDPEAGE